jgi:hypothetical protein
MEDFTKSELRQSWCAVVLHIQKVPLQGSYSVPAKSVLAFYFNVKVKFLHLTPNTLRFTGIRGFKDDC